MIQELNEYVKVKIAPSKIHGVGVFTLRDLSKGEMIYADMFPKTFKLPYSQFDKLRPEIRELLLNSWPQIVNGAAFMFPFCKTVAFMNHGYGNQINYDAIHDTMLKDIKEGEELFEDYRLIPNYKKAFSWLSTDSKITNVDKIMV